MIKRNMTPETEQVVRNTVAWLEDGGNDGSRFFDISYVFVDLKKTHKIDDEIDPEGCGTICCIAGYIAAEHSELDPILLEMTFFSGERERVGALLGLTGGESAKMFHPDSASYQVDAPRAAAMLRHFLETGAVNWAGTDPN